MKWLSAVSGSRGPAYRKLADSKDASFSSDLLPPPSSTINSNSMTRLYGRFARVRIRLYFVYGIIISTLIGIHIVRLNPRIAAHVWQPTPQARIDLHVLIPASEPSIGLCRTLLTGAVLNYPTPTLLNWDKNFTNADLREGGAQLAKIYAIQEWVERIRPEERNGLAMVLGGDDAWFQLRPSTLMERFRKLIAETNQLTASRMGRAYSEERIQNTVIWAAKKRCEPNFEDDIGCYPAPQSPLPEDLYGDNTDTAIGHNNFSSFRPRHPSTGMLMGPVEDIRQIVRRAWSKKDDKQRGQPGSNDFIYNTVFGEQEFMREVFHQRHMSWRARIARFFKARLGVVQPSIIDPHPTHQQMEHFFVRFHDFGMALDYNSLIMHDTSDSEWDARFLTRSSSQNLTLETDHLDCTPHLKPIPYDILNTYITSPRIQQGFVHQRTWRDLPLYTNMCTGNVPAVVYNSGDEASRERLWKQFWMQPGARSLLKTLKRHAFFDGPEDGREETGINLGGAMTDTGRKLSWETLCSKYEDDVFGELPDEEMETDSLGLTDGYFDESI